MTGSLSSLSGLRLTELVSFNFGQLSVIEELVDIIGNILGKKIEPKFALERAGDVKHSLADIEKAKVLLKYDCMRTVKEGIKVFVQNFTSVTQAMSERVNS